VKKPPKTPKLREPDPFETLAARLGIPREQLQDPVCRKLMADHFDAVREILDSPPKEDPELDKIQHAPGSVPGSRVKNNLINQQKYKHGTRDTGPHGGK